MGKTIFISENQTMDETIEIQKEFAGFSSFFSEIEDSFLQEPSEKTIQNILAFAGLSSGLQ